MSAPFDLVVVGRPSVDVMFSGLHEWPALGKDIESDGLGVCAGTSFNTPAAANRITTIGHGLTILNQPTDADERAVTLKLPDRYVLSLSTLEPRKGLDVLLAAMVPGLALATWQASLVAFALARAAAELARLAALGASLARVRL